MNQSTDNHYQLLIKALRAAKDAGDAILEAYNSDVSIEYKDDSSPLTLADKRSHEIIVNHLSAQLLSQIPILSEEGRDIPYNERKNWAYFWLIDPLDGTKEFIKKNGEFTVNIALIYRDKPILGVIYIPVKDKFYFTAESIGAYKLENSDILKLLRKEIRDNEIAHLIDRIIACSINLPLNHSPNSPVKIIGSRSHVTEELEGFADKMRKEYGEVEFISAGSSLKFCLVAEGEVDIYPRFGPTMEWDTAAGQAIVEKAGGKVMNIETYKDLRYNKESMLNPWFIVKKDAHLFLEMYFNNN